MLNEFFTNMLGNFGSGYAYEAPNGILLKTLPTKNAPEIASMRDKRFVLYREPDTGGEEKATLKCSTIKELTGNQQINARMNHSNDNVCPIKGTHILECNEKPDMNGRKDNGIGRRLLEIEHEARFTGDSDEVCEEEHIYKADTQLKENSFKEKYRTALFHIVLKAYVEFKQSGKSFEEIVPERVKEKTQSYLQDSDELYSFITEHYEFVEDKTDYVFTKDMFKVYKEFRLQGGLSVREKRKITEKAFKETLKTNINIKKIYKEKTQARWVKEKTGKNELRNVFLGLRLKMLEGSDSEEDLN
jgi:phage/plasmid-associated DNA primase